MRRAFSLTEILVVIAILAVMASIIFPIAGSAKTQANKTVCISNIHQLYVAMQLYKNDFGEYPPAAQPNILNNLYLGNVRLHCPAANEADHSVADYLLNGGNIGLILDPVKFPKMTEEWSACQELRQGEFPLVVDTNHSVAIEARNAGEAFFLVGREGGQIDKVRGDLLLDYSMGLTKPPCPSALGVSNL